MVKHGVQLGGLLGNALWGDGTIVLDTASRTVAFWPHGQADVEASAQ